MRNPSIRSIASACTLAVLSLGTAVQAADQLPRGDRQFVEKAAAGGMFEVEVSKLAQTRAADASVKSFASMLVADHTKANQELTQIATSKGFTPPAALPRDMQRKIDSLAKKNGADFDRAYMKDVGIDDHKKDIKLFEKQSKDGKDAELQAFATKTLPNLRHHLEDAQGNPVNKRR